jgi:hypothetical protein
MFEQRDRNGQMSMIDVSGDAPRTLWTEDGVLGSAVDRTHLVVHRQSETQLVRIDEKGLTVLTALGDVAQVIAVGDDRVVVEDDTTSINAYSFAGESVWSLAIAQNSDVSVVDGGIVVIDAEGLTFYS